MDLHSITGGAVQASGTIGAQLGGGTLGAFDRALGAMLDMRAWVGRLQPESGSPIDHGGLFAGPSELNVRGHMHGHGGTPYIPLSQVAFAPRESGMVMPHELPPSSYVFREPWFNRMLDIYPAVETVHHKSRRYSQGV